MAITTNPVSNGQITSSPIPPEILAAIMAGASGPPATAADTAPASPASDLPSGDAGLAVPSKSYPDSDAAGPSSDASIVPDEIKQLTTPPPPIPPPEPITKAIGNSTNVDSLAAQPPAAPTVKGPGLFAKLKAHLPDIIRGLGVAGGAMEGAGVGPFHEPVGAQMFQHAEEGAANRALEAKRIANEAEYHKSLASQYNLVPAGLDSNGNPIYMQQKDVGKYAGTELNVAGRKDVQNLKNAGALAVEQLKAGAPMTVDPELAQLAGQPQLSGKAINGTTLSSFVKVLNAKGIHIQDLGEEGLWALDKDGHKIRQVSVSSPSVARGRANAEARAANTPVDVFDSDGNLTSISEAQQLKSGVPKAATVFGEQGPTSANRTMSQMAATVQPHLDTLRSEISELSPYLGPAMGRWNDFLAGKVGSTGNPVLDQKMGRLISDFKLAASAVGRTHFAGRTGLPAAQYFGQLFNMARSPEELQGILQSIPSYIEGYTQMQNFTPKAGTPRAPARNGGAAANPSRNNTNARPPLTSFEKPQ